MGTNSKLQGKHGSYLFLESVFFAFAITNPFYSLKLHHSNLEDVLVIALDVKGGETEEVLPGTGIHKRNAKIVSLTNTDISTLSQLSDIPYPTDTSSHADSSIRSTNLLPLRFQLSIF